MFFTNGCLQEGSIAASQLAESSFPKVHVFIKKELWKEKRGRTGKITGFEEDGEMIF